MQETQLKVFLRDSAEYRSSLEYRLSNALTFVDSMNNLDLRLNTNTKCPIDAHCHRHCRKDPKITKDCIEFPGNYGYNCGIVVKIFKFSPGAIFVWYFHIWSG